jgi:hypothetical protein
VLRYAVPALGLIVVAAIGVFVLRQKKHGDGDSIAQVAQQPVSTGVSTQTGTESSNSGFYQSPTPAAKPARSAGSPEKQVAAAVPPEAPPPAPAAVGGTVDSLAKKEQQPVATDSPAALATLQPGVATDAREQQAKLEPKDEVAQTKNDNRPAAEKEEDAAKPNTENRKTAEPTAARSAPAADSIHSLNGANVQGIARSKVARQEERKDRDDSNTTTVAGHHFRKQGGVWVDTGYNSSRTAISVTRDSEQYRALIADEPGIKTVADQLDGEILLVWKGQAYRIK